MRPGVPDRSSSPPSWKRFGVALLFALSGALAALVVWGMATGTDRQFDKGTTSLASVILVQGLGAIALAALAVTLRRCGLKWRGHPAAIGGWLGLAVMLWLLWAVFRVGEYAS